MKQNKRVSLSLKLNLLIVLIILLVSAGLVWISYRIYSNRIDWFYMEQVERAALSAQDEIFPEMVAHFWAEIDTDGFRELRRDAVEARDEEMIRNWMLSRPSVFDSDLMGVSVFETDSNVDVSDADGDDDFSLFSDYEVMETMLSEVVKLFEISDAYIQYDRDGVTYNLVDPHENLLYIGSQEDQIDAFDRYDDNEYIPPTKYRSSYGWLCSASRPLITDYDGKIVGTVGVDTEMDLVMRTRRVFLVNCAIYVLILTAAAIAVTMLLLNRIAIDPLQRLSQAASDFAKDDDEMNETDVIRLPITSNDEIGDLYHSIQDMQTRIVGYTDHLTHITAERERVNTELNMAEKIQRDMLPANFPAFPDHPEFDLYAAMIPAREVGGDFYDFFMMDDTHLAVLIADVSDKCVPAALFMMSSMILIRYRAGKGGTPAEILTEVNGLICNSNKSKMFVTVWMGILDLTTGKMICTNAGHEYPFIRGADGQFRLLRDKHGLVIGGLERTVYKDYELELAPGDAVFVYTDGVPEANDINGELYGLQRLEATLNRSPKDDPQQILERIKADVDEYAAGAKQFDDLTMLCLELKSTVPPKTGDDLSEVPA